MDPTTLQRIIVGIEAALAPGLASMRPFLLLWMGALIFFEAVRVYGAVLEGGQHYKQAAVFVMRTLIFATVLWGWPTIMGTLVEDFVHAGLRFGGDQMTVAQFLDPGSLLVQGIATARPLAALVKANAGLTGAVYFFPFLVVWLFFLLAYALMACGVFLTQIEFRIVMPVSLLALAFFFFGPTRSMAAGVLSYGLNVGLRFFMQAILASLIFRLAPIMVPAITVGNAFDVSMLQAFGMVVVAGLMTYLFFKIPFVVAQHLSGSSGLSTGGLMQTAAGLVGMGTGATMLLRSHGPAWNIRQPPSLPPGGSAPRPLPVRAGPPPMPALQALNSTLRAGAHYLGHDQGGGGMHAPL